MKRVSMIVAVVLAAAGSVFGAGEVPPKVSYTVDPALAKGWMAKWEKGILHDSKERPCDKEMGEEIGWLVSPYVNGFYYGYVVTKDPKWIDMLIDFSDSWTKRGVKEPDGYVGWPKDNGTSTDVVPGLYTDNILGEAMGLMPMVKMADVINKDPALKAKYGEKAKAYLELAEKTFEKWDKRGCWREVKGGGVWVVPTFGIDKATNGWTKEYAKKGVDGFTLPDNKQNVVAEWLVALYDATGKAVYRERAEKWWKVQKSRMNLREGKYFVWNYWEPAGAWDYKPDGSTKHWVGVHPNGGYYDADVGGIVVAYEHGLVFDKKDMDRLVATNKEMWDKKVEGAKFLPIDGAGRNPKANGVLWSALVGYDGDLRKVFEANHQPASWGGLAGTPAYISRGTVAAK